MYAGEEVRITTTVADFDGTALTGAGVTSVIITTIHDPAGAAILSNQAMSYDTAHGLWLYMWNTAGITPGTYKAKVVVTGLDGTISWEWKRIRLARDLV